MTTQREIGEYGRQTAGGSYATRAMNRQPDRLRVMRYDRPIRRRWLTVVAVGLAGVAMIAAVIGLVISGHVWWAIAPKLGAVVCFLICRFNAFHASIRGVYEQGALVGAVVVDENPLRIAVAANMSCHGETVWGVKLVGVCALPGHRGSKGERVPCVATFRGVDPEEDIWLGFYPHPVCWGWGDPGTIHRAGQAIDQEEWQTVERLATLAAARTDVDYSTGVACFNDDLTPRTLSGEQEASLSGGASKRPALVVVGMQNDHFPGGAQTLEGAEAAANRAATLMAEFRDHECPVFHLKHRGTESLVKGTSGAEINRMVAPLKGEHVDTVKHGFIEWTERDFLDSLRSADVSTVAICGMPVEMYVDPLVRAAHEMGFKCYVIEDACAASAVIKRGGETIPAKMVHATTIASLECLAEVWDADGYLSDVFL